MVAISDNGHDHDEGHLCPACEFKSRLAVLIQRMADGHERHWDDLQGSLVDCMFDAMWALRRTRRERFTDEHDEIANSWDAATRLVELAVRLSNLRDRVMTDPSLEDDDEADEYSTE